MLMCDEDCGGNGASVGVGEVLVLVLSLVMVTLTLTVLVFVLDADSDGAGIRADVDSDGLLKRCWARAAGGRCVVGRASPAGARVYLFTQQCWR